MVETRCTARSRRRSASGSAPGRCRPAVALPPTRALAVELGVTRGVVVEAYAQLVAEGYLTSRSGGYTQVALASTGRTATPHRGRLSRLSSREPRPAVDFGYGRGNLAAFPRAAWLRSVRRVLTETPDERLGYLDGRGAVELRSALAAYLNRVRGTNADPRDDRHHQWLRPGGVAAAWRCWPPAAPQQWPSRTRRPPTTPVRSRARWG